MYRPLRRKKILIIVKNNCNEPTIQPHIFSVMGHRPIGLDARKMTFRFVIRLSGTLHARHVYLRRRMRNGGKSLNRVFLESAEYRSTS